MPLGVTLPSRATLRRYGMSQDDWLDLLREQKSVCGVCRLPPKNGKMVVDHHHVKGWKKMRPAQRKLFVRGLCCSFCNFYLLGRMMTANRADAVARYLRAHNKRKELFK